ncbi:MULTISPECIES: NADH-quinone oxidoreductase subunit B family protein [unclassified Lebetimonas]|uniref:NADH-quinone oxidoreductase subunit B family protein n=1 Tax=unclassified Lebetimonas TaxID=2648158 RepID=UPI00046702DF|nr:MULTISPECIES: NADH-quinone oxidoreductase subunit NuoB [unclassified Lebetimonas]
MLRFWKERFKTGIVTENIEIDKELEELRKNLKDKIKKLFAGSLAIRMVDSGSCNACEAECNALSNPYYDLERLGIHFVASPRHADVLLVSGVMTMNMYHHVWDAYHQVPNPKWVITLGDCAKDLGVFEKTYAIKGIDLPVDYHIPGCPPTPKDIIKGLIEFLKKIETESKN